MCLFIERVCRENSETNDGAEPRAGPEGAVKPTEGRLYEQKAFKIVFCREIYVSLHNDCINGLEKYLIRNRYIQLYKQNNYISNKNDCINGNEKCINDYFENDCIKIYLYI